MNKMGIDKKNLIAVIIHVSFCIIILVIPLVLMYNNGFDLNMCLGYLIRTLVLIFLFYINYFVLIDNLLFKKQIVQYIIVNILLTIGLVLLKDLVFELFMDHSRKGFERMKDMPRPPEFVRILGDYILFAFAVGMSVAVKVTRRWYSDSMNLEMIRTTQLEADLKNLRSQLNPHFLFNTLNNIYALISMDTNKAQDSIHRLSKLLRYILYENDQRFVSLAKELEFTQNYIDLMTLRLGKNVKLDIIIRDNSKDQQIISLLFITLLENAFKHGISSGNDSFINAKILVDEKGVLCTVENSLNESIENMESRKSGIGLTNLQKRLDLVYPRNHELQIEERDKSFFVLLRINF